LNKHKKLNNLAKHEKKQNKGIFKKKAKKMKSFYISKYNDLISPCKALNRVKFETSVKKQRDNLSSQKKKIEKNYFKNQLIKRDSRISKKKFSKVKFESAFKPQKSIFGTINNLRKKSSVGYLNLISVKNINLDKKSKVNKKHGIKPRKKSVRNKNMKQKLISDNKKQLINIHVHQKRQSMINGMNSF